MGRKKRQIKDGTGVYEYLRAVLFSVLVASASAGAIIALSALIMSYMTIPGVILSGLVIIILLLAGFISGYLAAKKIRKNGLQIGIICGASISVLLFLLSGVLFDCFGWQWISKMLVVTAAAAIGGVLGVNSRKKYH